MSYPKRRTTPDLSATSFIHQQAIAAGNDHFKSWQYNVVDELKPKSQEEIKRHLRATAFPFAVCFENWCGDFNVSSGIRNANAFNAREVFYIGDKKIDKRGCQGVQNYTDIHWLPTIDDFMKLKDRYIIVGADNIAGSVPLDTYKWMPETCIVFGSEGVGLTPQMQSMCQDIVHIQQYGSVRSINCSTASGIFMNDYVSKFRGSP
jgi:tRNA G18 (ribose-2'-O)-methylase SpoU